MTKYRLKTNINNCTVRNSLQILEAEKPLCCGDVPSGKGDSTDDHN